MGRFLVHMTFIVLPLLFANNVSADCSPHGLYVWPAIGTIKKNPIFVLDGYAYSMPVIYGLNTKYRIYLKSGKTKISLQVKETLTGQFRLAQAILVPASKLEAGKEYELCIDSLPPRQTAHIWDSKIHDYVPAKWTVSQEEDKDAPQWITMPKEKSKSYSMAGCGPSISISFSFDASENSAYLVKASVKSLQTGKVTSYYVGVTQKEINVGHGMCSGAFDFEEGENYEVEFSLMDASGNTTQSPTCALAFTKPSPEDPRK